MVSKQDFTKLFFLIRLVGGGVQLGPLRTSAANWPTVPAPGEYEDGGLGGILTGRGMNE
jgi:hypothetical protein